MKKIEMSAARKFRPSFERGQAAVGRSSLANSARCTSLPADPGSAGGTAVITADGETNGPFTDRLSALEPRPQALVSNDDPELGLGRFTILNNTKPLTPEIR
jgi:hypothetical protein